MSQNEIPDLVTSTLDSYFSIALADGMSNFSYYFFSKSGGAAFGTRQLPSHTQLGGHCLEGIGHRSTGFEKPTPIQGTSCFGDYCHSISNDVKDRKVRPISAPAMRNSSPGSKRMNPCPYQLAFKSILLERAEMRLLGPSGTSIKTDMLEELKFNNEDVRTIFGF